MTLTAYDGVTCPVPVLTRLATAGSTGTNYGQTGASASAASLANDGNTFFESILVGDRFVCAVAIASATVTVSSVVVRDNGSNPITGLTFSLIARAQFGAMALEIWGSVGNPTQNSNAPWTSFVTLSAAARVNFSMTQWRGCSGYSTSVTGGNAAAQTNWTIASTGFNHSNGLQLNYIANANSAVPVIGSTLPPMLQQKVINLPFASLSLLGGWSPIEGKGFSPFWGGTQTSSIYATISVQLLGNTVSLDDLTFICRDDGTGVLLNNPANSLPIYDVSQVTGLDDIGISNASSAIDGADGSYVDAKFSTGKSIVIDGTATMALPVDEALLDTMKNSFRATPLDNGVPLFYKKPLYTPRILYIKPTGVKLDLSRNRSLGQVPFEVTALSSDSRAYSPSVSDSTISGKTLRFATSGNIASYPKLYFNVYSGDQGVGSPFTFQNYEWSSYTGNEGVIQINSASSVLPVGPYCLDLANRTLTQIGSSSYNATNPDVDYSSAIITRGWWGLVPGIQNNIQMTRGGSNSITESFYLVRRDAWQ